MLRIALGLCTGIMHNIHKNIHKADAYFSTSVTAFCVAFSLGIEDKVVEEGCWLLARVFMFIGASGSLLGVEITW